MNYRAPFFSLTLWGLLSLWALFGGLELAEQLHFVAEFGTEDQKGQDLDEEVLLQLASGLKSEMPSLDTPGHVSLSEGVAQQSVPLFFERIRLSYLPLRETVPSLRLHQQVRVYRI